MGSIVPSNTQSRGRGDVKLDNSPAWDRNLTGTLQTARVISVTTTSEVAPGKRNPSRGARVRCASMTWKNPVTQGLPGKRQLTTDNDEIHGFYD